MSYNNVLADSLIRLKNAQDAKLMEVELMFSKMFLNCLFLLKREGYVSDFYVQEIRRGVSRIFVILKYYKGVGVISKVKLFTKPGRRVYIKARKMYSYYDGLGVLAVSTSRGIFSGECAAGMKIGGELLFGVY